ncbi:hypothetical protein IPH67_00005 [bacterium]|nr:MAG: hypothetical protein IPH67_00005 [bacterium]
MYCLSCEQIENNTSFNSFLLGPLARFDYAQLSFPGGDSIGARPILTYIFGFTKLGVITSTYPTYIQAQTNQTL